MVTKVTVNGQVVGEVYETSCGWGYLMYHNDMGYEGMDTIGEAIAECTDDAIQWASGYVEYCRKHAQANYITALKILGEVG